jgi:hypothetical protein
MIKPSQISKKKTETVRQKKRKTLDDQTKSDLWQKDSKRKAEKLQSLDDQTKSDFQEKDRNSKAKKKKALDDQTKSDLWQKDSKHKAKKEKLPKLKKLSRICMNQTDNANQTKGETRP